MQGWLLCDAAPSLCLPQKPTLYPAMLRLLAEYHSSWSVQTCLKESALPIHNRRCRYAVLAQTSIEMIFHIDPSIWGSVVQPLGGSCDHEYPAPNCLPSPSFSWCPHCSLWRICREVQGSHVSWACCQWCEASKWGTKSHNPIAMRWQGQAEQRVAEQRRPWQKMGLGRERSMVQYIFSFGLF